MKIKSIIAQLMLLSMSVYTMSCNQEIELNLPVYEPKMVLEFYLEDNKPLRCLLQESVNYTDNSVSFKLIDNATVILSYNGKNDTLANQLITDRKLGKVYNYSNPKVLKLQPNVVYQVLVKDRNGREMKGQTQVMSAIPIDSLVYKFDAKQKASAGLIFTDPGKSVDYYRLLAFKNSQVLSDSTTWDISFDDLPFNGKKFNFYTGSSYVKGDTVVGRLYRLTLEHRQFAQSVANAQASNRNPFGQPANIRSNVSGGIGIFTTLSFDEKIIIVK